MKPSSYLYLSVLIVGLLGCQQADPPKCWSASAPDEPRLLNPWKTNIRIRSGETVNLQLTEKPSGFLFMEDGSGGVQVSRYSGLKDGTFQNVEPVMASINQQCTNCTGSNIVINGASK